MASYVPACPPQLTHPAILLLVHVFLSFVNASVQLQSLPSQLHPMLPAGFVGTARIPGLPCPWKIWAVGYHQVNIHPWVQWKRRLGGHEGCFQISEAFLRVRDVDGSVWLQGAEAVEGRAAKAGCLHYWHRFSNLRTVQGCNWLIMRGSPAAGSRGLDGSALTGGGGLSEALILRPRL